MVLEFSDAPTIARFPRTIPSTLRRPDTTRVDARARRRERKEEEKLQKREEVKRLKSLRLKDLQKRMERVGREGGIEIGEDGKSHSVFWERVAGNVG